MNVLEDFSLAWKSSAALILLMLQLFSPTCVRGLSQNKSCITSECHPNLAMELRAKSTHPLFRQQKCEGCHSLHTSKYEKLLIRRKDRLCFGCHPEMKGKEGVHDPVKKGDCLSCHLPHSSMHAKLLKEDEGVLCLECHNQEKFRGPYIHGPLAEGRCSPCHDSHTSDNIALLKQEPRENCEKCHPLKPRVLLSHGGYPLKRSECISCHASHVSQDRRFLKKYLHKPFSENRCEDCHIKRRLKLKTKATVLCLSCHEDVKKSFLKIQPHLIAGERICNSCHNSHAGSDPYLLLSSQERFCFSCHWDSKPNRKGVAHPMKEKGCFDCHAGHGSNFPAMMKSDGISSCTGCHKTQGKFTHPVGEKTIDIRTNQPIDCITCHDPKEGRYEANLRLPGERLCLQCHYREIP